MNRAGVALLGGLTAALVMGAMALAQGIPWGEEKAAPALPAIFADRAADRLAAEEVARQDAYRKLVERIYGTAVDGKTCVHDMVLASRTLDTALTGEIRGMREVDSRYYDDGRVEIAMKVTMRQVVEIIEKTYKSVEVNDRLVSEDTIENITKENRDQDIVVVGRGALKDSPGLAKIRAMRAAEVDCYTRIAQRVFGLKIVGETTVRDFALLNDRIKSRVTVDLLNGVVFTKYSSVADGTAEATGQITIRQVVESLTRIYRRYGEGSKLTIDDVMRVEHNYHDMVISEVGVGVAPAADAPVEDSKVVIEKELHKVTVIQQTPAAENK